MVHCIISRFALAHHLTPPRDGSSARETGKRANSLINRILTSPGICGEQNTDSALPDDVDMHSGSNAEGEAIWLRPLLLQRQARAHRAPTFSYSFSSTFNSAERVQEFYFHNHPERRNQEQLSPPVDDRDFLSGVAAIIVSNGHCCGN